MQILPQIRNTGSELMRAEADPVLEKLWTRSCRCCGPQTSIYFCRSTSLAWVHQIHNISGSYEINNVTLDDVESSPARCPDPGAATKY